MIRLECEDCFKTFEAYDRFDLEDFYKSDGEMHCPSCDGRLSRIE